MVEKSIIEELSEERKKLQDEGKLPEWFTTQGWQMFKEKFLFEAEGYTDTCMSIAEHLAQYAPTRTKSMEFLNETWEQKFFEILYRGWLAPSTPVLANTGTNRGCSVSCSGGIVEDSVYSFYDRQKEVAVLSQHGFGTSSYLGNIRPRGAPISRGGKASGVLPVLKGFVNVAKDISQGSQRRGAWAGYIEIDHPDFWEVSEYLKNNPDDLNIGWNVSNSFIEKLEQGDEDSIARYQRAMKIKCLTGKGYFFFIDKVNEQQPVMYKDQGLSCKASNLCTEITLHSDEVETFSCVLSSINLSKYDEFKNTDTIFVATVFLDCVAQDFIEKGKNIRGIERVVRFTERHRALGLGALGFHTYLQQKMIPIESLEAHFINMEIFDHISKESLRASSWMAKEWGEPEVCKGYGLRNTHRIAIAPNTTSALIAGSVSQGIEPIYKNVYTQGTAAGEMYRINPVLLKLMIERNVYNKKTLNRIADNNGSVKNETWLSEDEKLVFKTAFEIDQNVLVRLASTRQQYIDQAQSLNLFFSAEEDEDYISSVFKGAFLDPRIKSIYYLRSESGVTVTKGECLACEG